MSDSRGLFIVIEGIDRSGKSTQAQKLLNALGAEFPMKIQNYPDRNEQTTGPEIDAFLKSSKFIYDNSVYIHDLFSKNRHALNSKVRATLLTGKTVIANRYSFSGIAYSHAKGFGWRAASEAEIGLVKPDLVFLLDVSAEEVSAREGFGREIFERVGFQDCVRRDMKALINPKFWRVVDGSASEEEIHKILKDTTLNALNNLRTDLSTLTLKDFNLDSYATYYD